MNTSEYYSRPPLIVLDESPSDGSVRWQAAISLSDSMLRKTSRMHVRRGSTGGPDAAEQAIQQAYKAVRDLSESCDIGVPPLSECVIQFDRRVSTR